jgi:hypothetical protein
LALVDLAIVGALNRDPLQIVAHSAATIANAHQTGSGVVVRKLESLPPVTFPMGVRGPADATRGHVAGASAGRSGADPVRGVVALPVAGA